MEKERVDANHVTGEEVILDHYLQLLVCHWS